MKKGKNELEKNLTMERKNASLLIKPFSTHRQFFLKVFFEKILSQEIIRLFLQMQNIKNYFYGRND